MDNYQKLDKECHFHMYNRLPVTIVKGSGAKVWDIHGKEYIDALAGIAVNNVGHCHPAVVKAITEQASRLMHITNIFSNDVQAELAHLLTTSSGFDKVFFCNSGMEANEGAIKLVRKHGDLVGKKGPIISFTGCFHGRSMATITMGKKKFQEGFGPLPDGFEILPFNDVNVLESKLHKEVKAVFVECIQGEGGIRPANPQFMDKLSYLCKKFNILLVCDEIQTGMGRTGRMFGHQHYSIKPDIITLAKGLGGGFPIGAVLTSDEIAATFDPGDHGTTFGGNPLACAAAMASLKAILDDNLIEASREKGDYLLNQLTSILKDSPDIVGIRGQGLMIGIELNFPARPVVLNMLARGYIINATADNTLRLVPPFVIKYDEMDSLVKNLQKAIIEEKTMIN